MVRGTTDVVSAHGVPVDPLDRCVLWYQSQEIRPSDLFFFSRLIVKTETYTPEQVANVVELRAAAEGLTLAEGVLERL